MSQRFYETAKLLSLLFFSGKRRSAAKIYDVLSTHNNLAESSLYLNLGYWKCATTYDTACEALAELLGEQAGIKRGDVILDCGCGFGDQDYYWLRRFSPARITAINVTQSQVNAASKRFPAPELYFVKGDATNLSFKDGEFDHVIALESAFHFEPRDAFFREAKRVLKAGGRLALADIFVTEEPPTRFRRVLAKIGRNFWQTPECNVYGAQVYRAKLEQAGFSDIKMLIISEQVFAPFKAYARQRVLDAEVKLRVHPLLRRIWGGDYGGFRGHEYAIITAVKV